MIKEKQNNNTNNLFYSQLLHLIDNNHEIVKLASIIKWEEFDFAFEKYYRKDFGRPAKPIRLMVSLLILKQLYNLSDEEIVARWVENPYWQYFSGEQYFQITIPCAPTELTKFRNRIGVAGVEKIFEISIKIHGKDAEEKEVIPDTTVQEKNITFPTDSKLHLKIINRCRKIAKENNIALRQSYVRV